MYKICYVVTIPMTVEAFFVPQLRYLAENNFDVTVVCSKDLNLQEKLGKSVRFYPIDIPRGVSINGSIYAVKALVKLFRKEKFDLVQYSTPNAAFYASIAAKMSGIPIRNYHLMGFRYLGASGIGRKVLKEIEKMTCHFSTHIECVSKSNLELGVEEKIFSSKKATVIWNGSTGGVNTKKFNYTYREQWRKEIREKLGYTPEDFIYGFVGRITRDKGINELLSAFFEMNDDSNLLLVGNAEDSDTLDQHLLERARKDRNVKFVDTVNDIERYFAAIDVLILPSYREGFGNVIIEAAAMGTPAIVSNIPGPIDAIEVEKTAYLFENKDISNLKSVMIRIKNVDYKQMGDNAARFAKERFDSIVLCQKILKRKKEILK